jgi:hypothetical protein
MNLEAWPSSADEATIKGPSGLICRISDVQRVSRTILMVKHTSASAYASAYEIVSSCTTL